MMTPKQLRENPTTPPWMIAALDALAPLDPIDAANQALMLSEVVGAWALYGSRGIGK